MYNYFVSKKRKRRERIRTEREYEIKNCLKLYENGCTRIIFVKN